MTLATKKIVVRIKDVDKRLDIFVAERLKTTRSQAQKLIKEGSIFIDDNVVTKPNTKIKKEYKIKIVPKIVESGSQKTESQELPHIEVISETDTYAVINKPAGLLVHPTEAEETITLAAWIEKEYPKTKKVGDNPKIRPGIVHRLDKDASGLLVIAKTQKMFLHLKKQFQERTVLKEYSVLIYGVPDTNHESIDFDIDRGKDGRMVSRPKTDKFSLKTVDKIQPGKKALTEFWIEKSFVRFTLLKVKIHTGRTHQIRVHMFAYNHPVVGDKLYVNRNLIKKTEQKLDRLFLHAKKLCFKDLNNEEVCFEKDIPDELKNFMSKLT